MGILDRRGLYSRSEYNRALSRHILLAWLCLSR
jgi:hypothetical protein